MELTDRVTAAKTDEGVFSDLVREYTPLIRAQIARVSYAPAVIDKDELLSVGLMAFYEAVRNYDPERGAFIPYARLLIEKRIIDEYRRVPQTLILADTDIDSKPGSESEQQELSDELKQLAQELAAYKLTLEDVNHDAPKHKRTRAEVRGLVGWMLGKPEIVDCVLKKRYVPMVLLEQYGKLSRKALDKRRRYLIACVLVATGDYVFLREYLNL